jgi:hypothetical protein
MLRSSRSPGNLPRLPGRCLFRRVVTTKVLICHRDFVPGATRLAKGDSYRRIDRSGLPHKKCSDDFCNRANSRARTCGRGHTATARSNKIKDFKAHRPTVDTPLEPLARKFAPVTDFLPKWLFALIEGSILRKLASAAADRLSPFDLKVGRQGFPRQL